MSVLDADWNPRWLACAEAHGVSRDELRNVDFVCWIGRHVNAFRASRRMGETRLSESDHVALTAYLWDVARRHA